MQHACHRCGALVEDGVPFCPQCGAPQIRVGGPAPSEPTTPPLEPGTPAQIQPPTQPLPTTAHFPRAAAPPYTPSDQVNWGVANLGVFAIGVVVGVLSALPVLTLGCCLWLVAGGASAAAFYRRRLHAPLISGTAGAKVGAATGGVAFAFFCITQAAVMLLAGERYREAFRQEMQRRAGADPSAMELLSNPAALAVLITIGVVIILFAFLIFAAIGGALGASVSRQRSR